jgi:hypothetical protein
MCESGSIVHVQSVTQLCEVRLDLDRGDIRASRLDLVARVHDPVQDRAYERSIVEIDVPSLRRQLTDDQS